MPTVRKSKGLEKNFCIKQKNGKVELLKSITMEVKAPERTAVGIVLDADDDLTAAWHSVKNRLKELGNDYFDPSALPTVPEPAGTIIEGRRRIGIWLMPDNRLPGELEDFIEKMIPCKDPVWPLSKDYINLIPEGDRKFKQGKILRAEIHAWLATRREPRKMGSAIGYSDLTVDAANTTAFLVWLRKMFKETQ